MLDQEYLKNIFLNSAPDYYNRKALDILLKYTINEHTDNNNNLFLSRLCDFEKNPNKTKENWLSLFAEIHTRYMIAGHIKEQGYTTRFSEKENNDICISKNGKNIYVEVKAIMPSNFQSDYDKFLKEIRNIPSGKYILIKIKNDNSDKNKIFNKIKNKLQNLNSDYSCDDFEIKVIQDAQNKNETAFIDPTITFWVNQDGLKEVITKKLKDKPKQIEKADIICFYSFHYMFGAEDFCEAIKNVATKINSINNKKFLCFTLWNDAKLIAIMKEDEKWITKNIGDIF